MIYNNLYYTIPKSTLSPIKDIIKIVTIWHNKIKEKWH